MTTENEKAKQIFVEKVKELFLQKNNMQSQKALSEEETVLQKYHIIIMTF